MSTTLVTPFELFKEISENGICVDLQGLVRKQSELQGQELEALEELDEATEFPRLRREYPEAFSFKKGDAPRFNPRSRKHLAAWFQDKGEEPPHSFAMEALEPRLPHELFELVVKARRLREYWGDLGTLRKFLQIDGKIRVEWTEAKTGRFYTGKPPIQTMAKVCREFLVPSEGNEFSVVDWDQQELYLLAYASQEPRLLDLFDRGVDPHIGVYQAITGRPASDDRDVFSQQRNVGKMLNYAIIYGLDARGLGGRLRIPNDKAQLLIDAYFKAMPVLEAWRAQQSHEVSASGYVETFGGRHIPLELDPTRRDAAQSFMRKAINYKIQGSAADQMLNALQVIYASGLLPHIRAQMHDAFLVEAPRGDTEVTAKIKKIMEVPFVGHATPAEVKGPAPTWRQAMDWIEEDLPADE